MITTGTVRRVRDPGSLRKMPARLYYRKTAYRYERERNTVFILVLFMLLIIFLLYFS